MMTDHQCMALICAIVGCARTVVDCLPESTDLHKNNLDVIMTQCANWLDLDE